MARRMSIDVMRGLTVAGMILVNMPGSWTHVYPALRHADWHGLTLADLVFPWFLFVMGAVIPLSLRPGEGAVLRVLRRAAILFAIGIALALLPDFDVASLRVAGVLQRIAVVYAICALLALYASPRGWFVLFVGLLLGYWALLAPWGYEAGTNMAARIDRALLPGAMYRGDWDPEGLASTLPAIASALAGMLAMTLGGRWRIAAAGMMMLGAGLMWSLVFPLNKNLWTSSYVLVTAGLGALLLAALMQAFDRDAPPRWGAPFAALGRSAIAAYILHILVIHALLALGWRSALFDALMATGLPAMAMSALAGVIYTCLCALPIWWLDRRGVIIRI